MTTAPAVSLSLAPHPELEPAPTAAPTGDLLGMLARHAQTLLAADQVWVFVCMQAGDATDSLALAASSPPAGERVLEAREAAAATLRGQGARFRRVSFGESGISAIPIHFDGSAAGAIAAAWSPGHSLTERKTDVLRELAVLSAPILAARAQAATSDAGAAPVAGATGYGPALVAVVKDFDQLPALEDTRARVLRALARRHSATGEAIALIETDPGLVAAVLRAANGDLPRGRKRIVGVPAAVETIGPDGIVELVSDWPTFRLLSRSSWPVQTLTMHANATRFAADVVARAIGSTLRHELRAMALLHDIGKLVLARAWKAYPQRLNASLAAPEHRVAIERRLLGLDHAALGALLIERWGLPKGLATAVENHHGEQAHEPSTIVRLADMLAHHMHGHPIDEQSIVRVARAAGLDQPALRRILFDLPRSRGGRRADPSPLTPMQTKVLRLMAEGKKFKAIASDLGLSESTIRSHAHTMYARLGIVDRAQAVLLGVERGWI